MAGNTGKLPSDFDAPVALSESLERMAHLVLSDQSLDAVLQYLVALAEAGIGAVDGVSVTLAATTHMETRHATSEEVTDADQAQYDSQRGPCVQATSTAQTVSARISDGRDKWPAFTDRAMAGGYREVLSVPLVVGSGAFGALNLYSRQESGFGDDER